MIKDQEEVIERLTKLKNRKILYGSKTGIIIEEFKVLQEDIETVLNTLKEKDKEIEKYKGLYNKMLANLVKADHKNIENNEMIDLMARAIDNCNDQLEINTFKNKEHIKEYFRELATEMLQEGE